MASTQVLKSRIRSVKNTKQITKAMQLVSASKMRRAQEAEKSSDPYTEMAREILTYIASQGVTRQHELFKVREVSKRLIIVVSADKGLAGAYNSNINRATINELSKDAEGGIYTEVVAIGRRISQQTAKLKSVNVVGAYENLPDKPAGRELRAIFETALGKFSDGSVDAVDIVYTKFFSSLRQEVVVERILPAGFQEVEVSSDIRESEYEPSLEEVLSSVTKRLVESQIFQAILDAKASEHSMRMVAMKNATDNASDLVDDLTLVMNKARQGAITQELAEISGGVEALSQ